MPGLFAAESLEQVDLGQPSSERIRLTTQYLRTVMVADEVVRVFLQPDPSKRTLRLGYVALRFSLQTLLIISNYHTLISTC